MMRGIEQKTTLEQKLEKLRQICEKAPDNAIGLLALAETAFRRGLRLEALEAYQKVLKDESVAEAHLCMAQMYRHHSLFQEAISELRTLFEIEPGYPEAHVFARELASETTLPEDIQEVLVAGCGNDELDLARVRLSIARNLVLREGQELVAIQDANSGDPTFGYYIGETKKRLAYCEEVLSNLGQLEDARRAYLADQDRQRQIERERNRELGDLDVPRAAPVEAEEGASLTEPVELTGADPLEVGDSSDLESSEFLGDLTADSVDPGAEMEDDSESEPVSLPEIESSQEERESYIVPEEMVAEAQPEFVEASPEAAQEDSAEVREPALWDDPPRVHAPVQDSGPPHQPVFAHQEMTLDLTPTLVGDLPEPEREPVGVEEVIESSLPLMSPPGELWDDGPISQTQPEPDFSLSQDSLPAEDSADSDGFGFSTTDLGDDLVARPEPPAEIPVEELQVEELQVEEASVEEAPAVAAEGIDYDQLYQPLLASLESLIQTLAKTRSVSSVFLLNREGYAIAQQVKDPTSAERFSEFIVETVSFLEAFADSPQYWVLECAGGIVVIQAVDSYHFLITIGQSGANFGALRYTMDRVRPNFEQVLQAVSLE